ncbi:P2 family phage major capsid protein [Pseudomonas paraeruginosa]|uniref:P2 family phage major capsid protein n=1 Tax=Pseudomonas paraeruginosa TaxID=2994495 RepID=UPI0029C0CAEB|nr:P2 family phage major capsid protein [Pseudomonas paraeruginosa]
MRQETRLAFNGYLAQQSKINGVESVTVTYTVAPTPAQKLDSAIQESNAFLKKINIIPVDEAEGEAILLGVNGPTASRTNNVFRRERYMKGRTGAPCTKLLKRRLLDTWKRPGDVMVLGFTAEEGHRLDDFRERNPDRPVIAPLIERGLGKEDCKAIIARAGIELPTMYRLGYENANCIGCVKGGEGYFRAIREDFPKQFEALCKVQDELGPGSYLFRNRQTGERYSLRDLPSGPIRRNEAIPACSFFCELAEADIIHKEPA